MPPYSSPKAFNNLSDYQALLSELFLILEKNVVADLSEGYPHFSINIEDKAAGKDPVILFYSKIITLIQQSWKIKKKQLQHIPFNFDSAMSSINTNYSETFSSIVNIQKDQDKWLLFLKTEINRNALYFIILISYLDDDLVKINIILDSIIPALLKSAETENERLMLQYLDFKCRLTFKLTSIKKYKESHPEAKKNPFIIAYCSLRSKPIKTELFYSLLNGLTKTPLKFDANLASFIILFVQNELAHFIIKNISENLDNLPLFTSEISNMVAANYLPKSLYSKDSNPENAILQVISLQNSLKTFSFNYHLPTKKNSELTQYLNDIKLMKVMIYHRINHLNFPQNIWGDLEAEAIAIILQKNYDSWPKSQKKCFFFNTSKLLSRRDLSLTPLNENFLNTNNELIANLLLDNMSESAIEFLQVRIKHSPSNQNKENQGLLAIIFFINGLPKEDIADSQHMLSHLDFYTSILSLSKTPKELLAFMNSVSSFHFTIDNLEKLLDSFHGISDSFLKENFLSLQEYFKNIFDKNIPFLRFELSRIQVEIKDYTLAKKFFEVILKLQNILGENSPQKLLGSTLIISEPELKVSEEKPTLIEQTGAATLQFNRDNQVLLGAEIPFNRLINDIVQSIDTNKKLVITPFHAMQAFKKSKCKSKPLENKDLFTFYRYLFNIVEVSFDIFVLGSFKHDAHTKNHKISIKMVLEEAFEHLSKLEENYKEVYIYLLTEAVGRRSLYFLLFYVLIVDTHLKPNKNLYEWIKGLIREKTSVNERYLIQYLAFLYTSIRESESLEESDNFFDDLAQNPFYKAHGIFDEPVNKSWEALKQLLATPLSFSEIPDFIKLLIQINFVNNFLMHCKHVTKDELLIVIDLLQQLSQKNYFPKFFSVENVLFTSFSYAQRISHIFNLLSYFNQAISQIKINYDNKNKMSIFSEVTSNILYLSLVFFAKVDSVNLDHNILYRLALSSVKILKTEQLENVCDSIEEQRYFCQIIFQLIFVIFNKQYENENSLIHLMNEINLFVEEFYSLGLWQETCKLLSFFLHYPIIQGVRIPSKKYEQYASLMYVLEFIEGQFLFSENRLLQYEIVIFKNMLPEKLHLDQTDSFNKISHTFLKDNFPSINDALPDKFFLKIGLIVSKYYELNEADNTCGQPYKKFEAFKQYSHQLGKSLNLSKREINKCFNHKIASKPIEPEVLKQKEKATSSIEDHKKVKSPKEPAVKHEIDISSQKSAEAAQKAFEEELTRKEHRKQLDEALKKESDARQEQHRLLKQQKAKDEKANQALQKEEKIRKTLERKQQEEQSKAQREAEKTRRSEEHQRRMQAQAEAKKITIEKQRAAAEQKAAEAAAAAEAEAEAAQKAKKEQETQVIQETEAAEESQTAQEVPTLQEAQIAEDSEAIEEVFALQEAQTTEDPETIEEVFALQEAQTTEDPEAIEEVFALQEAQTTEDPEAIEEVFALQEAQTTEDSQTIEEVFALQEAQIAEDSEAIEEVSALQEAQTTEDSEAIQKIQQHTEIEAKKIPELAVEPEENASEVFLDFIEEDCAKIALPRIKLPPILLNFITLLLEITEQLVVMGGSSLVSIHNEIAHFSDYDFRVFEYDLEMLAKKLLSQQHRGVIECSQPSGTIPIIRVIFAYLSSCIEIEIAAGTKASTQTIDNAMKAIKAKIDLTPTSCYIAFLPKNLADSHTDINSDEFEIRGSKQAIFDLQNKLIGMVEGPYGLIRRQDLNLATLKNIFNEYPGYVLMEEDIYYVNTSIQLTKLPKKSFEEKQLGPNEIFPDECNYLIEATTEQLDAIYTLTGHQPENRFEKFKEDAIRGIRLGKFLSHFPDYKLNNTLYQIIENPNTNWPDYFKELLKNDDTQSQRVGRVSTTLENLFERFNKITYPIIKESFAPVNILDLLGRLRVLEGLTGISFNDIGPTLIALKACTFADAYTKKLNFCSLVLIHFCMQISMLSFEKQIEALLNWHFFALAYCLKPGDLLLQNYIIYKVLHFEKYLQNPIKQQQILEYLNINLFELYGFLNIQLDSMIAFIDEHYFKKYIISLGKISPLETEGLVRNQILLRPAQLTQLQRKARDLVRQAPCQEYLEFQKRFGGRLVLLCQRQFAQIKAQQEYLRQHTFQENAAISEQKPAFNPGFYQGPLEKNSNNRELVIQQTTIRR